MLSFDVAITNECSNCTVAIGAWYHLTICIIMLKLYILGLFSPGLWGLVNNAGVGPAAIGPMEWLTLQNYRDCYEVNLLGLVDVTMVFLPLIKLEHGRIVNTSSILGRSAVSIAHAPYIGSKDLPLKESLMS